MPTIKILWVVDGPVHAHESTFNDGSKRGHLVTTRNLPFTVFGTDYDGNATNETYTPNSPFGLGIAKREIENQSLLPDYSFRISVVTREPAQLDPDGPGGPLEPAQFDRTNFRFIDTDTATGGRYIDQFDEIWLFVFHPLDEPSASGTNYIDPSAGKIGLWAISPSEVSAITDFMNRGGGVLAMGDHSYTGASVCGQLPRIGKMRKWVPEQNPPPRHGPNRKDTLTPNGPYFAETDTVPQTIYPELKQRLPSYFYLSPPANPAPHEIMRTTTGELIDVFPDHPHEGETLGVPYRTPMYSFHGRFNPPDGVIDYSNAAEWPPYNFTALGPVRPNIIAYARPNNDSSKEKNTNSGDASRFSTLPGFGSNDASAFGVVSVYDGRRANIRVGRIVVDSTWHHWMNYNMQELSESTDPAVQAMYRKIVNYWVNVAKWLEPLPGLRTLGLRVTRMAVDSFQALKFMRDTTVETFGEEALKKINKYFPLGDEESVFESLLPKDTYHFLRMAEEGTSQEVVNNKKTYTTVPGASMGSFGQQMRVMLWGGIYREIYLMLFDNQLGKILEPVHWDEQKVAAAIAKGVQNGVALFLEKENRKLKASASMMAEIRNSLKGFKPDAKNYAFRIPSAKVSLKLRGLLFENPLFAMMAEKKSFYLEVLSYKNGMPSGNLRVPEKGRLDLQPSKQAGGMQYLADVEIAGGNFQEGQEWLVRIFLRDQQDASFRTLLWESLHTGNPQEWNNPALSGGEQKTSHPAMEAKIWLECLAIPLLNASDKEITKSSARKPAKKK